MRVFIFECMCFYLIGNGIFLYNISSWQKFGLLLIACKPETVFLFVRDKTHTYNAATRFFLAQNH